LQLYNKIFFNKRCIKAKRLTMSIAFIVLFTTYTMAQNSISIQRMIGFPTEERGFDKGVSACFSGGIER